MATFVNTAATIPGATGSFTATLPASWAAGDLVLVAVGYKFAPNASAITVADGANSWTFVGVRSDTAAGPAAGVDTGRTSTWLYARVMVGGEANPTVTLTGTINTNTCITEAWRPDSGKTWTDAASLASIPQIVANETTAATPVTGSATFATQPVAADGATISSFSCIPTDLGTALATGVITNAGLSSITNTVRQYTENPLNNDIAMASATHTGWTGTGSGATTITHTYTGPANNYGALMAVWLRETAGGTDATATPAVISAPATVGDPARTSTEEAVTVAAVTAMPAVALSSKEEAVAVAAVASVGTVAISGGLTATRVHTTTLVPPPGIGTGLTVATVAAVTAVGTPVVPVVAPAATVTATAAVGAAALAFTELAPTVVATVAVPAPGITSAEEAVTVAAVAAVPAPTVVTSTPTVVTATVVAAAAVLPAVALAATEMAANIGLAVALPAPTVQVGVTHTAGFVGALTNLPTPAVVITSPNATATPAPVAAVASVRTVQRPRPAPAVTVRRGGDPPYIIGRKSVWEQAVARQRSRLTRV